MYEYIARFKNLGFGMFVHFGLYSVAGKGEWYLACNKNADKTKYEALTSHFKITKNWAKNLVKTAKEIFGTKILWIENGKVPEYFLFIVGLLSNEENIKKDL